jgi:hypothetical protein
MNHENQFDELLHEALGEYREAEPLVGLERRILHRLQAQPAGRSLRWIWGAIATCLALVLIGVWIGVKNPTPPKEGGVGHPATELQQEASARPSPTRSLVKQPEVTGRSKLNSKPTSPVLFVRATSPAALTAQQFPTPINTTAQEQALSVIARAHPDALAVSNEEPRLLAIAPLEIARLTSVNQNIGEN